MAKITFTERRRNSSYWSSSFIPPVEHKYYTSDAEAAYMDIKPLCNVLYFENGNKVRDYDALCFLKKDVRES